MKCVYRDIAFSLLENLFYRARIRKFKIVPRLWNFELHPREIDFRREDNLHRDSRSIIIRCSGKSGKARGSIRLLIVIVKT